MDKEDSNLEDGSADTLQMEVQNKKELIKIKKKKDHPRSVGQCQIV